MDLKRVPQSCRGLVHNGITQLFPPKNMGLIQVVKNMPQLVG